MHSLNHSTCKRDENSFDLNMFSRLPNTTSHNQFYFCQRLKYRMKHFYQHILSIALIKEKIYCLVTKISIFTWYNTVKYLLTLLERWSCDKVYCQTGWFQFCSAPRHYSLGHQIMTFWFPWWFLQSTAVGFYSLHHLNYYGRGNIWQC